MAATEGTVHAAVTAALARFAASAQLGEFCAPTRRNAQLAILDCIGCALAGSREPVAQVIWRFVAGAGRGPATAIGTPLSMPPLEAALANGTMAHAIGYDDLSHQLHGHPSVVLLPALLALAEAENSTKSELLCAYLVGYEVACRVAAAMSPEFFDQLGWHPTAPLGVIGAAAGAARLLALSPEDTASTISLAASQAAGLRQNFGTMTKFVHAGMAARNAVAATQLVRAGLTAVPDGLEGRAGFIHAFSGGAGHDARRAIEGLDRAQHFADGGIQIKRYPCCGEMHQALDALFEVLAVRKIDADAVEEVTIFVDFDLPRSLIYTRPSNGQEARFSLEYCVAVALLDGRLTLASFADDRIQRSEIAALLPRIRKARNPGFEGRVAKTERQTTVTIRLAGGDQISRTLERPPTGWVGVADEDGIASKFRDCASTVLHDTAVAALLAELSDLETEQSIHTITRLLRTEASDRDPLVRV